MLLILFFIFNGQSSKCLYSTLEKNVFYRIAAKCSPERYLLGVSSLPSINLTSQSPWRSPFFPKEALRFLLFSHLLVTDTPLEQDKGSVHLPYLPPFSGQVSSSDGGGGRQGRRGGEGYGKGCSGGRVKARFCLPPSPQPSRFPSQGSSQWLQEIIALISPHSEQ